MQYFIKTPWWLKKIYPDRLWDIATNENIIYLTFDDGPHPVATPFVLNALKKYNEASTYINSNLFRPPYGRIKASQVKGIGESLKKKSAKIVMWDVLSGDFDESLSKEKCLNNVISKTRPGSIIVFHDSEKAFPRLKYTLPVFLEIFAEKGYSFHSL